MNRFSSRKLGIYSGVLYIILISITIPLLMILDPDFSKSVTRFDPMSQLGNTEFSGIYYRSLHVIAGILALLYIEFEFIPSRSIYKKLNNWNWAVRAIRLGYIGQIAMGIFNESIFPQHLFATIVFAAGGVSCIVLVSFNLDNQVDHKTELKRLIFSGYAISIIAMFNALYFRYSAIRGIWQFFVMISVISWYIYEARKFKTLNGQIPILNAVPIIKVNRTTHLMFAFGVYLIIFGFLLYFVPTMWPWTCSENDRKCDLSNVIPLLISGTILISFVLYHQLQVKQNQKNLETASTTA